MQEYQMPIQGQQMPGQGMQEYQIPVQGMQGYQMPAQGMKGHQMMVGQGMEPQLPGQRIHHEPVGHMVLGQPMSMVPTFKQPDISGQGNDSQQMTKAVASRQAEVTGQFAVPGSVSFSSMPSGSQSQPVAPSNHQTSLPTQQTTFPTLHTVLPTPHQTTLPAPKTALPKPILSSAANMEPTNLHLLSSLSLSLTTPAPVVTSSPPPPPRPAVPMPGTTTSTPPAQPPPQLSEDERVARLSQEVERLQSLVSNFSSKTLGGQSP